MILSSRQIPKMNLRRASAVNPTSQSGIPISADMSKSLFQHLTQTPPASPGLPSLRPRHGKPPATRQYRQSVRFVAWFCGVGLITWFVLSTMVRDQTLNHVASTMHGGAYEIKEIDTLPSGPAPVVVTDKRGRARWTVSIPPGLNFPLRPSQYTDICSRSMDVAMHVAQLKSHGGSSGHAAHQDYYHVDKNFMDVAEAEEHGVLPGLRGKQATSAQKMWHSVMGSEDDTTALKDLTVCKTSLTFVLETEDAGFGSTMMGLWMSYGLAKKEGRAFFVDDTNWAYGKYLTYFAPIPKPSCLPPPRTQILPCPHHARHLLVSGATNFYTFGHAFHEEFEDPRAMEVRRQRPIYNLLRTGYEALFRLRDDDEAYVTSRTADLYPSAAQPGMKVGIHVRHGDRHPLEFQYQESYIPLDRYTAVAHELIAATYNASKQGTSTQGLSGFESQSSLILASDDPDVYTSDEFRTTATRAQERIALASKSVLDAAAAAESEPADPNRPFVDEAIGWEGGFFSALFWTLGATAPTASAKVAEAAARRDVAPSELALRLRELVGRTYLLDLKVLGEGTDGVVCAVSAIGCRLLAVMMGWDRAFVQNRWRNLDGDFDWNSIVWDFH